ncbi:MAG: hypothetical protein KKE50_05935 [Nanoarchaeota archaeon]|nr:hypothetical protein [Nanoarchaeota archaeon]
MKNVYLSIIFLFTVLLSISLVYAEPCYPKNTPGCQDICGDQICGNLESSLPCEPQWGPQCIYCPEDCDSCIDTEKGENEFIKGIVTYNRQEIKEDVCTKDLEVGQGRPDLYKQLVEISCANENGPNTGGMKSSTVMCEYGCENGACLENEPSFTECTDTDPDKDIYFQGTARYNNIENRDSCIDATRGVVRECSENGCNLHEYYCNKGGQGLSPENNITFDSIKCSYKCKDGACVRPPCNGCLIGENDCIQYGIRKNSSYCDVSGEMVQFKQEESVCDNNFECESNVCVDGKCVSGNLLWKILNWFRNLFG